MTSTTVFDAADGTPESASAKPEIDGPPTRLAHQPALDGLRAIAVLGVLLFHDQTRIAGTYGTGGFLGVDIFFVLSGFLITSLLVFEFRREGRVALRSFWGRRFRRLYPALCIAMVLVAVYAVLATPAQREAVKGDAIFSLLYIQNWHIIWAHSGLSPLDHVWSLSVEEQWYLVWPVVVFFVLRRSTKFKRAAIVPFVAAIGASVYAMSHFFSKTNITHSYNGTDTRAQELLVGAALAFVLLNIRRVPSTARTRWALECLGWAGAAFVAYQLMTAHTRDAFLYRGGFLLVCVATAAIIAAVMQVDGPLRRVLSTSVLVRIGLISYGLYLYQNVLFNLLTPARMHVSGVRLFGIRVAVTIAFSLVSYQLIERPIRMGMSSGRRRRLMIGSVAVALAASLLIVLSVSTAVPPSLASDATLTFLGRVRQSAPRSSVRVLVLGESLPFALRSGTAQVASATRLTGATFGTYGCGLMAGMVVVGGVRLKSPSYCGGTLPAYDSVLSAFAPNVVVLTVGDAEVYDRVVAGAYLSPGSQRWAAAFDRSLSDVQRMVRSHGGSLAIATHPCPAVPVAGPLGRLQGDPARLHAVNSVLRSFAAAQHLRLVDLATLMCPNGQPAVRIGGVVAETPKGLAPAAQVAIWRYIVARVVTTSS